MFEFFRNFSETIKGLAMSSGLAGMSWKELVMIFISFLFLYLAIAKKFEPLLLVPIAFGMLLTNLPDAGLYHSELWESSESYNVGRILKEGGLLDILYIGIKSGIFPPLIFLGIGAMSDFGPLIANPKSFLLGAAAQGGIFLTFAGAALLGFSKEECGSIAIIGGADGPTSIFVSSRLLSASNSDISTGTIALAAYTYMALIPVIQPPIMRLLTTEKERAVKMKQLRNVSQREKIIFPVAVTLITAMIIPDAAVLIGMMMLGNLFRECKVCERLSDTASNSLMNIVTILLGVSVGATTKAEKILNFDFLKVILLGALAFAIGTACGLLIGKLMYRISGGKINPLIGSAGVSAVPMAARMSERIGLQADPSNHLLMHAMGPNVAGTIGSAVAAGVLLQVCQ